MNNICLNMGKIVCLHFEKVGVTNKTNDQIKNWFDYCCLLTRPPPAPSFGSHLTCSACVSYHHGNRHTREKWRRKKVRETKTEWITSYFFPFFAATQNYVACVPIFKGVTCCIATWSRTLQVRLQCKHFFCAHYSLSTPSATANTLLFISSTTVT